MPTFISRDLHAKMQNARVSETCQVDNKERDATSVSSKWNMDSLRNILHYIWNLEWREKIEHDCLFCDSTNFREVVFEVSFDPNHPGQPGK